MLERLRSTYFYICWLPLGLYLVSDVYVSASTGWGQWAIVVVVLPPMMLSAAFLLTGGLITSDAIARGEPKWKLIFATALSGSVFVWFAGRSLVLKLLEW